MYRAILSTRSRLSLLAKIKSTMWPSWWLSSKESACSAGDTGLDPWVGKSPCRRKSQPTPVLFLKNPLDRGAWWAIFQGLAKSRTKLNAWAQPWKHDANLTDGTGAGRGSANFETLDANLKDGTGAGLGSANFGANRTASEVRVSFTLLSGWNKKVKRRIIFHDTWKSCKIQIVRSKIKLNWDTTCLHLGIQNSLEVSLFHTKYSVFGSLQQKFVDLQSGIKTRNILALEKEIDFGPTLKVIKTRQTSHFPPNGLGSALLCEGPIKTSRNSSRAMLI